MGLIRANPGQIALPGFENRDVASVMEAANSNVVSIGNVKITRGRKKKKRPVFRFPPLDAKALKLRWYQEQAKKEVYQKISAGEKSIGIFLAGGAGKTALASSIIKDATQNAKNKIRKCLFLVDRTVLIEQAALELLGFGVPCATLQGKVKRSVLRDVIASADTPVVVASAQTIEARIKEGYSIEEILGEINGPIFVDEGHVAFYRGGVEKVCNYYWDAYKSPSLILTASPWRTNPDEYMGQKCTASVEGPPIPQLIQEGSLLPARYLKPGESFDITEIDTTRDGDYDSKQLESQAISKGLIKAVVTEWADYAFRNHDDSVRSAPRSTAVFCPTVKIAKLMAQEFSRQGYPAEWQDGKTSFSDRADQTERLRTGETIALTCCDTLTAGWNFKPLEFIVYFKASKSRQNFFQACWRGDRPSPETNKKDFFIMDCGGNLQRLGWPMDASDYYIGPPKKKRPAYAAGEMVKECPECGAEVARNAKECTECDYEFGLSDDRKDEIEDLDSLNFENSVVEVFSKGDREKIKEFRILKRRAYNEGRHPNEAIKEYAASHGNALPKTAWHYACCFHRYQGKINRKKYKKYLSKAAQSAGLKDQHLSFWVDIEMSLEFNQPSNLAPAFTGDWQELLGFFIGDDLAAIKKKYRDLAKEYHPDSAAVGTGATMTTEQATSYITKLNKAWEEAKEYFCTP